MGFSEACNRVDNYTGQDEVERGRRLAARHTASQNLLNAQTLLAEVTKLVNNSLDRSQYLTGQAKELKELQKKLQDRLSEMTLDLLAGRRAGPAPQYELPTFPIDWNTADWRDVTKPIATLRATAPGM